MCLSFAAVLSFDPFELGTGGGGVPSPGQRAECPQFPDHSHGYAHMCVPVGSSETGLPDSSMETEKLHVELAAPLRV